MNFISKLVFKGIALISLTIGNLSTRTCCYWGFYEPELPKDKPGNIDK